jgi:signal peptidase I
MNTKQIVARLVYGKSLKRTLIRAVFLGALAYLFFGQCFRPTVLRGKSMEPTYLDGQIGLINKLKYRTTHPKRGDVVVIYTKGKKSYYLKRVLALGGETIEFRNGDLYIEGSRMDEPYLADKGHWSMQECLVPPREYFVAGDNREIAIQNHRVGIVAKEKIAGGLIL